MSEQTYSVPPELLYKAKDALLWPQGSRGYERLINYLARRGHPTISIFDIKRERTRRAQARKRKRREGGQR